MEQRLNVFQRFPAGKDFEFGQRNGDFGLVVCVGEFLRVFLMEASGKLCIGVDLQWKCLVDGEDLKFRLS